MAKKGAEMETQRMAEIRPAGEEDGEEDAHRCTEWPVL